MTNFLNQPFWSQGIWGNIWLDYLNALVVFVSSWLLILLVRAIALKKLEQLSHKTKNNFDNRLIAALKTIKAPLIITVSLWCASRFLAINPIGDRLLYGLLFLVIATSAIRFTEAIIRSMFGEIIQKNKQAKPLLHFFSIAIRVVLWILGLIIILSSFGVNVSSLITGLGISGVILALALQNVILDLFSSLTLYLDRPIQIGDKISVGADTGIVQKIGIKSTRIKSADGQIIIIPNRNLTTSSINNFQSNSQRRILNVITIPHNSSDEQCRKAIDSIKQLLNLAPGISLDHVSITDFNDQGLKLEIDYQFQNIDDEAEYLAQKQAINLEIRQALKKAGVLTPAK